MNLTEVHDPLMRLFGLERLQDGLVKLDTPRQQPKFDFRSAATRARELAQQEARSHGFLIELSKDEGLSYQRDY